MAEFLLYCFDKSGNAYKVALMLNLCGADWQARFVDYMNGETRTDRFREINAMGEIPVLEHRDQSLTQSGVILDYLAEVLARFGPRNQNERREILRWLLFDNHKLTSYTATLRFLRTFTDQGETPVTEFLEGRSRGALGVLDGQLSTRPFALGERMTIADLSMCGYLYFEDEIGIDITDFPNVCRWLDDIRSVPGWAHPYDLMPGSADG